MNTNFWLLKEESCSQHINIHWDGIFKYNLQIISQQKCIFMLPSGIKVNFSPFHFLWWVITMLLSISASAILISVFKHTWQLFQLILYWPWKNDKIYDIFKSYKFTTVYFLLIKKSRIWSSYWALIISWGNRIFRKYHTNGAEGINTSTHQQSCNYSPFSSFGIKCKRQDTIRLWRV